MASTIQRGRWWRRGLLLALCVLLASPYAWIIKIQSGGLPEKEAESLLLPDVSPLPALSHQDWSPYPTALNIRSIYPVMGWSWRGLCRSDNDRRVLCVSGMLLVANARGVTRG
jgi:hypothetical protein